MSLMCGVAALAFVALVAGFSRICKAWDEHLWRRDERRAEADLKALVLSYREMEVAAMLNGFERTLDEITHLPVVGE